MRSLVCFVVLCCVGAFVVWVCCCVYVRCLCCCEVCFVIVFGVLWFASLCVVMVVCFI